MENENIENQSLNDSQQNVERVSANQRNSANNANFVRNAAEVASKTNNPYAKAIGTAVKAADKISGGRASQSLGKHMNFLNKVTPGGRIGQALINKMGESGTTDRIGSALSKKNENGANSKKSSSVGDRLNSVGTNSAPPQEPEETDGTFKNIKIAVTTIVTIIMASPFVATVFVFCVLFIAASQIFINSIDIGTADKLTDEQTEQKIQNSESKWNNEITDDHENLSYFYQNDIYFQNSQEKDGFYIQVTRKNNEADLEKLNDFYGNSISFNDGVDMNVTYHFYYKLYYIYEYYKREYHVELDLALLMATLNIQSKDKTIVFSSNTIGYDDDQVALGADNERFSYTKTHVYKSTRTNSQYDIEVLAQNMISYQAIETCIDSNGKKVSKNTLRDSEIGTQVLTCEEGQTYNVTEPKYDIDEEKYDNFLCKFLEEKYFLNESSGTSSSSSGSGDPLEYGDNYSDGNGSIVPGAVLSSEPDPSAAINYWKNYVDPNNFVYPKDTLTGLSLGAWPKDYASIPTQLENMVQYQNAYIWPTSPTGGTYTYVYEHNGMDIMAKFGTPIYSPVDGTLEYSTWGHTTNKGSDETAYSVSIEPDIKVTYGGTTINCIFFTHMSGIRYRCDNTSQCNRKVKQGELLGFVGNAAGSASSVGWAPHLHLTFYNSSSYSTGLRTSTLEKFYNITSNTKRNAGE